MRQSNSGQDGKDPLAHDGGDERCGAGELHQGGDAEDPLRASLDQLGAKVRKPQIRRNSPFSYSIVSKVHTDF